MRRVCILSTIISLFILIFLCSSCVSREPKGVIKNIIEPYMEFSHPVMYWETRDDSTALYRILENTNDINCILYGLENVHDVKSTGSATYLLRDNPDGFLGLTRLEMDRDLVTEYEFDTELTASSDKPWAVSRNDVIAIRGLDDNGTNIILRVEFARIEPEESFHPGANPLPIISFKESEWFSTSDEIIDMTMLDDGGMLAVALLDEDDPEKKWLQFINNASVISERISENPVVDLGGFSPDGTIYLATFDLGFRVDVYLIDLETLETNAITRVAINTRTGNPVWHPNGRYLMYTLDYEDEFKVDATRLRGEQLYLYSLDSDASRRLAVFEEMKLWVDFAPNGDFFLYSSTPGVMSRTGRAVVLTDIESGMETWRISYVPWKPREFTTANQNMLVPDETQHVVSYTVGGESDIRFIWGPGGELPVENR